MIALEPGDGFAKAACASPRDTRRRDWSAVCAPAVACSPPGCVALPGGAVVVDVVPFGTVTMHMPYDPGLRCRLIDAVKVGRPSEAKVIGDVAANTHGAGGGFGGLCE